MVGIYVADIPGNPVVDQLYINGKRQRMARFPNAVTDKNVFDTWDLSHQAKPDPANDPLTPERALTAVPEDSEAFRLGFRSGDLIQEINGTPIATIQKLIEYISAQKNRDSKHRFLVIRSQDKIKITVHRNLAEVYPSVSRLQSSGT